MSDAIRAWMDAGKHLPDVMRDFHDQKDLFKAMHDLQRPDPVAGDRQDAFAVDWLTGHQYVVDRFLWFMARRGYTLQRSRARLPFRDLHADVQDATTKRNAASAGALIAFMGIREAGKE